MRTSKIVILLSLLLSVCSQSIYGGDIWVSTQGDDLATGDKEQPLQTLHQALRMAREWRRLNDPRVVSGIHIHIKSGTYFMSEPLFVRGEDSGSETSPTYIEGEETGKVVISGGIRVIGWQKQGRYWTAAAPRSGSRPILTRQLWAGEKKCHMASLFEGNKMERLIQFDKTSRTITIPTPAQLTAEKDFKQMEMMMHQRWAIAYLRVKDYTINGNSTTLTFHDPESRTEFEHPWPQPVIGGEFGNSSFRLINALPFLDQPGEWYQDYSTGMLYYMAAEGEDPNDMEMTIPSCSTLMEVAGSRYNRIQHIHFSNLHFQYAAWNRPAFYGHVTLQGGFPIIDAYKLQQEGLPWALHLENQAWITRPEHAISVSWAQNVSFEGCQFRHLASTGLDCVEGISDLRIEGNHFEDIGGSALLCGSFAEGVSEVHRPFPVPADDDAYSQRIIIRHNHIYDATNEDWGCVGIGCGFVRDTNIEYNNIDHVNYSGICVGWGWTSHDTGMRNNRICHNQVTNFALQLYDAGGIYTLSAQPGSEISYNVIDKRGIAPYATNDRGFYIYLDEATDGYTIDGNWCPEAYFGDNKPGPDVVWKQNGPYVNHPNKNQ